MILLSGKLVETWTSKEGDCIILNADDGVAFSICKDHPSWIASGMDRVIKENPGLEVGIVVYSKSKELFNGAHKNNGGGSEDGRYEEQREAVGERATAAQVRLRSGEAL